MLEFSEDMCKHGLAYRTSLKTRQYCLTLNILWFLGVIFQILLQNSSQIGLGLLKVYKKDYQIECNVETVHSDNEF